MSGSAALEYGFPSTHSTNAVSVALYAIHVLNSDVSQGLSPTARTAWTWVCYVYAFSIAFGRLYCGMHGFTDVVAGSALGALLAYCQILWGEPIYDWIMDGSYVRPFIYMAILFTVVKTHPEPADDCPCFDDSVAFTGVLVGITWSYWNLLQPHSILRLLSLLNLSIPDIAIGVPLTSWKTMLRIPIGVVIIVTYRAITKPLLLKVLPPLFRIMEHLDLDLPRRYFLRASQYRVVPQLKRDDNVLPSASDVGQMLGEVRKRRGRAISIGPQSMADAREVIAYRQEARRRERSASTDRGHDRRPSQSRLTMSPTAVEFNDGNTSPGARKGSTHSRNSSTVVANISTTTGAQMTSRHSSNPNAAANASSMDFQVAEKNEDEQSEQDAKADADERRAIFSGLPRVRARYDVEVVTKLIVYAGIGWWAREGCPAVFELLGFGADESL
jgi:hypothetical protein